MRCLAIFLMLFIAGCGVTEVEEYNTDTNITYSMEVSKQTFAFDSGWVIEQSIINEGDCLVAFYCDINNGGQFYYSQSTNDQDFTGHNYIGDGDLAFPYTIKHEGVYYTAYGNQAADKIYLMKSEDALNWEYMNSGEPIKSRSGGDWHYMWNPGFIISGNKVVMYVETSDEGGQDNVGLSYLEYDLTTKETKTTEHVIKHGGNPWYGYMNGELMLIHGSTHKGYWTIESKHDDLSTANIRVEEKGVHICDPHLVQTVRGDWLLSFSYDQKYTIFAYF